MSAHTTLFFANQKAAVWFYRELQIGRFRHRLLVLLGHKMRRINNIAVIDLNTYSIE